MTTLAKSLTRTRLEAVFYERMAQVDALLDYASGRRGLPALEDLPSLRETEYQRLGTTSGKALTGRWAKAFNDTLALLKDFRNAEVHTSSPSSEAELRQAAETAGSVLQALVQRLTTQAA